MTTIIPPEFAAALKKGGLSEYFSRLAPSHRKEYLKWIIEAKKPETRAARIAKALKMLAEKQGR